MATTQQIQPLDRTQPTQPSQPPSSRSDGSAGSRIIGPRGDGADRGPRRPHLAVQGDHGLDDPLAGLSLLLGAARLLVLPGRHVSEHTCSLNS